MSSIFTKIINRELPAKIEYEDDDLIVIHDIAPKAPVHLLIIPKEEIPSVEELEEKHASLLIKMIKTAQAMKIHMNVEGYKLTFHVGEKGGQVVFHLHMHFLGYR